jgi:hypothetical protein
MNFKELYEGAEPKLPGAPKGVQIMTPQQFVAKSAEGEEPEPNEELDENLHKWFKEKWVRFGPDGKIRGSCARGDDSEGKPKCLPQAKAHALGKKGRASAGARKRREDPNPERSGKAINVATKKKSNEDVTEDFGKRVKDMSDEANIMYRFDINDGKLKQRMVGNPQRQQAIAAGFRDSHEQALKLHNIIRSKFSNNKFVQKQGDKWVQVNPYNDKSLSEEELDEACWKGYHKEGNKKMFGKTYPNCVKNTNEEQEGVAEGWKEESQELEDWSKEVSMRLYKAHESQRPALARQLSKIEQKNFGSSLNKGSLTQLVHSTLMALQKGQMVHYDPQRVGQMPFGSAVGDDAKLIAQYNITRDELAGYRMLHDKNMVDNLEQFLKLRRLVRAKSWPLEYFEELEKLTPEEAWLKMADDLNWSKDDMNEEVQAKTDDKLLAYYAQRKAERQKQQPDVSKDQLDEKCWDTHKQVGMKSKGGKMVPNCVPKESVEEAKHSCPHCGGPMFEAAMMNEKKDACYYKVKSRYKVWPSAYASGALVKCRKKGASNWGTGGKKNEDIEEATKLAAPTRPIGDPELTDYLDRIRNQDKKKTDKYKLPYIHRSSVVGYYNEEGKKYNTDAIKKALAERPKALLKKNEKMKHSDGEQEQFFNIGFAALVGIALDEQTNELIIVNTCPGAGSCKVDCFAMKGGKVQFAGPWLSDGRILTYLLNDPNGFFEQLKNDISKEAMKGKKGGYKVSIRWHDAGDFFSPEYADMAFKLAESLPDVDFYAYTKVADVALGEKPKNFIINWSEGASSSQEKKVKGADPELSKTKNSRIVPSNLFYDLLVKDEKKNLVKGPEGQWQVIPDKLPELKSRLAKEYGITPNSILSYTEWDQKGKKIPNMKWNVIITPGEPDLTAKDPGVLSTLLLKH